MAERLRVKRPLKALATSFLCPEAGEAFRTFESDLVFFESDEGARCYFPPYVPFVGEKYDTYRILIYAKAQNLAGNPDVRERYFRLGGQAVYRLCETNADATPTYADLDIGPVCCGVLPAVAGVLLYASEGHRIESLADPFPVLVPDSMGASVVDSHPNPTPPPRQGQREECGRARPGGRGGPLVQSLTRPSVGRRPFSAAEWRMPWRQCCGCARNSERS